MMAITRIWFAGLLLLVLLNGITACSNSNNFIGYTPKGIDGLLDRYSDYRIDIKPVDSKNINYSVSLNSFLDDTQILIPTTKDVNFKINYKNNIHFLLKTSIPGTIYENTITGTSNSIIKLSVPNTPVNFEIYPFSSTLPPLQFTHSFSSINDNDDINFDFPYPDYYTGSIVPKNNLCFNGYKVILVTKDGFSSGEGQITNCKFSVPYLNSDWIEYSFIIFKNEANSFKPYFKLPINYYNHLFSIEGELDGHLFSITTDKSIDGDFSYYIALKGLTNSYLADNKFTSQGKISGEIETNKQSINIDLFSGEYDLYLIPKTINNISLYSKMITIPECSHLDYSFKAKRKIKFKILTNKKEAVANAEVDVEKVLLFSSIQNFPVSGNSDENGEVELLLDDNYSFFRVRILPSDNYKGIGKVTSIYLDNKTNEYIIELDQYAFSEGQLINDRGEFVVNSAIEVIDTSSNLSIYKTVTDIKGKFSIPVIK